MRNAIRIIAIVLLASIDIYCGYEIYTESKEDNVQITEFEEITETIKVNGDEVDENHKFIHFDTIDESNLYEVIAVFKTTACFDNGFRYYDFTKANTEKEFNAYIEKCKALSFYDTNLTAEYGDNS